VANRAIDFLKRVGSEPFLMVASFDEPHGPYAAPSEYHNAFDVESIPKRPNFGTLDENKPRLQHIHKDAVWNNGRNWETDREDMRRIYADNTYIDREIGRIPNAVETFAPRDTTIIYTSDRGDMQ